MDGEHELHGAENGVEGILFTSKRTDEVVDLIHEISDKGHVMGVSPTTLEYKSPFVRIRGTEELVGVEAIRHFFNLPDKHRTA